MPNLPRLYANENFPLATGEQLRRIGFDVLTAVEVGQANRRIPDDAVLAFATALGRAVLTYNRRDFIRLHRRGDPHSGIVTCTVDADAVALAFRVNLALSAEPVIEGTVLRVNREGFEVERRSPSP